MDKENKSLLIGRNPIIEAIKSHQDIDKIYVAAGTEGSVKKIYAMAKDNGIVITKTDKSKLDKMVPGEKHQGVIAVIPAYEYSEMADIYRKAEESGEEPFIVILDDISDPHNLGAIIRTVECAGAHGVIIPKRRACGLTEVVAKSSAGAIVNVPCVKVTNLSRTIDEIKEKGVWVAACDMDGESYYKADLKGGIAVVIGNEGKGISRLVKEKCDFVVSMPIMGSINSLNASNAAAVILYEVRRQRNLANEQ